MKKSLSILIVIVLLVCTTSISSATQSLGDDWVNLPELDGTKAYLIQETYDAADGTAVSDWGTSNTAVTYQGRLNLEFADNFIFEKMFTAPVTSGKLVTQFEMKLLSGSLNQFPIVEDSSWGNSLGRIVMAGGFKPNDSTTIGKAGDIVYGNEYGIRMVTDLDAKTFDFYIYDYTSNNLVFEKTGLAYDNAAAANQAAGLFLQGYQAGEMLIDNFLVYTWIPQTPGDGWINLPELDGTKAYLIQETYDAADGTAVSDWGASNTAVTYQGRLNLEFADNFIFEKMFTAPVTSGKLVTQFEMKLLSGSLNQFPIVEDSSWGNSLGRIVMAGGFKPNDNAAIGKVGDIVYGNEYGIRMVTDLDAKTFDFYIYDYTSNNLVFEKTGLAYDNAAAANQAAGLFLQGYQAGEMLIDNFLVYTMASSIVPPSGNRLTLYVATNGNDSATGTIETPLKSLAGAKDKIASIKASSGLPSDGAIVYFHEGNYTIDSTINFTSEDSGSDNGWITYTNYPGESVSFNGAYVLPGDQFTSVTDSKILNRLPQNSTGDVKQINLSALGFSVSALGNIQKENPFSGSAAATTALSVDGEQQILTRWPNVDADGGFARFTNVSGQTFTCTAPNLSKWQNVDQIYLRGYFGFNWFDNTSNIKINNANSGLITVPDSKDIYVITNNMRYYVMNILEELDSPGEYYIDRNSGILYYWPTKDITNSVVTLTKLSGALVNINQASYISFAGLRFADSRSDGFLMKNASHITIEDCEFYNLGTRAITGSDANNENTSFNNNNITIKNCDISCMGKGGIDIDGGNIANLTPSQNLIENCKIYDFNRAIYSSMPGVHIRGVGTIVRNNEIYDGTQGALWFKGALHVVENNKIHDVVKWASDAGAVYGGKSWHERGTVFQNNEFYNIWGYDDAHYPTIKHGANGIYFDDIMSGNIVKNNIFHDMSNGVFAHGGSDVTVSNNIFYNVEAPIDFHIIQGMQNANISSQDQKWSTIMAKSDFSSSIWYSTFPQMNGLLNNASRWMPRNDQATNNLFYKSGTNYTLSSGLGGYSPDDTGLATEYSPTAKWDTWPYYVVAQNIRYSKLGYQNGLVCAGNWTAASSPGFANEAGGNFMLTSKGLLAVQAQIPGFSNIDTTVIGVK